MPNSEAYWHQDKRGNWHGELGESDMLALAWRDPKTDRVKRWGFGANRVLEGLRHCKSVTIHAGPTGWVEQTDAGKRYVTADTITDEERAKATAEELARLLNQIESEAGQ